MPLFKFKKTVFPDKKTPRWLDVMLIVVLIPIILIVLLLIGLFLLANWVYSKFTPKNLLNKAGPPAEQKPRYLIQNEKIRIQLHEIEAWEEEGPIEEEWYKTTYDEETTLYKAITEPEIEGIHHKMITTFALEQDNGLFLQRIVLPETGEPKKLSSELIWIDYADLKIKAVEPVGCYYLYLEKGLIKGFNKQENIEIQVSHFQP